VFDRIEREGRPADGHRGRAEKADRAKRAVVQRGSLGEQALRAGVVAVTPERERRRAVGADGRQRVVVEGRERGEMGFGRAGRWRVAAATGVEETPRRGSRRGRRRPLIAALAVGPFGGRRARRVLAWRVLARRPDRLCHTGGYGDAG
jgi:hypothetical protein